MSEPISAADKKRIVVDFLRRCNDYSDAKLRDYNARLGADVGRAPGEEVMVLADKISHWTAYRAFNDHAIAEIEAGELDDWFRD